MTHFEHSSDAVKNYDWTGVNTSYNAKGNGGTLNVSSKINN